MSGQALAKHPNDPKMLNDLGQTLMRLGRIDEAIACFERAVDLAPDMWAYHFNLAVADGQVGRAPGEPSFHVALGNSLEKIGRIADTSASIGFSSRWMPRS